MYKLKNLFMTAGIQTRVSTDVEFSHFVFQSFWQFLDNNWGEVCEEDKHANDAALKSGARILGAYMFKDETKIWIIADAEEEDEKRVVTILYPEEY